MSLKTTSLVSVICCVILASCASAPPSWMGNYREEYPSSDYIVQRGSGETVEFAKTNSLQAIAQYFQTTVNASMETQLKTMSSGNNYVEQRSTLTDVQVTSNIDLFGVEFSEPYFSKQENLWYILAYNHRESAWRQYSPRIENERTAFLALYNQSGGQPDIFTEYLYYNRAWQKGRDFLETLEFGRLLMDGIDTKYRDDRATVSSLPATLQHKAQQCSLRLSVQGDFEEIATSEIKKAFSSMGFTVSEKSGVYDLKVTVSNNLTKHSDLQAAYPVIDITVTNRDGKSVYSLQHKGERSVASNRNVAIRRGLKRTAEDAGEMILEDFREF